MEKAVPNSKFVEHSTEIIRQYKIKKCLWILIYTFRNSYPVYFLALKKLLTDWGQERLQEAFDESNVKLLDLLPEAEKSESVLTKVKNEF